MLPRQQSKKQNLIVNITATLREESNAEETFARRQIREI